MKKYNNLEDAIKRIENLEKENEALKKNWSIIKTER